MADGTDNDRLTVGLLKQELAYQREHFDFRFDAFEKELADHEKRIRLLERFSIIGHVGQAIGTIFAGWFGASR